ncbi:bifunctional methylenetetrahydrofolate dehydrogenase/methenyltetrahydrofolate cyclohydrolase FolD [Halomonas titanicae]|uniref:bifunctional methylenetetrahydrofolate dehydrogenase/methenyltetrahydrofolate cyclohydrolase FolD n=1 Tax=Halomonadaceae TaxID=28256 RepID=UPI00048627F9|nr:MULTISPECIES: bifunctional methylenetetrahydrofolate dehydrogenase/methenyltetrahydrofolate cyclohydrolase FolD [Halomonas]MAO50322.1 bifunctional methylenetetrahydrofolate dehydrogenase/methenyltetrahydrofolate cyclohydrolase FolD [Pusillimonas sp.]MCE7521123.1 bifunctional methylenetetrahydrofolate dehydrogenase/methenyltetrahydrofolate cyclohydrolase FolD [Halomonas titanicae]HAV44064.1 bifunctional methylenetetrahydrofolate dehydrogenase/methenyltetrahydrofolate cyclohydrolase FolD [Halom|tara:strand:+ start:9030 stop:9956 length:927 start_codon:yes stop_codon:yes gene_type:complete
MSATTQASAALIDGKACAERVLAEVAESVKHLAAEGTTPGLAVVLIGEDPASHVYVRNKIRKAEAVGIRSFEHRFDTTLSQAELLSLIDTLNKDPEVNGILVQLPLPDTIDEEAVIQAIDPLKDVDGFHHANVGGLVQGSDVLTPCTPSGCLRLLQETCGDLSGKHAVVVGRSNIVGKPMASLLLHAHCSVTLLHSRSVNAETIARQADIVVAAVGRPKMIDASWLKPGAVVIDVGISRVEQAINGENEGERKTRLVGDVDFASASQVAKAITPVPGGVGPMTIAYLMQNTVTATKLQHRQAAQPALT